MTDEYEEQIEQQAIVPPYDDAERSRIIALMPSRMKKKFGKYDAFIPIELGLGVIPKEDRELERVVIENFSHLINLLNYNDNKELALMFYQELKVRLGANRSIDGILLKTIFEPRTRIAVNEAARKRGFVDRMIGKKKDEEEVV